MLFYYGQAIVFKGLGCKNNEQIMEKFMQIWSWTQKRPKTQQKSILGGSWAVLGRGLGPSWASFGCFWPPLGRLLDVQNRASFKHWPIMGSKRASGWILGRFGRVLERFWKNLGRNFGGFEVF